MPRARRLLAVAVTTIAAGVVAPAASAGPLVASAGECDGRPASQVFLPWLDPAFYVQAPGAAAESRKGWTLDGASIVKGNEPWHVIDAKDSRSLSLPDGASATTDPMCVGIDHPTLRFFATQTGGSPLARLDASALFEDAAGGVHEAPIGSTGGYGWSPTAPMVVNAALLPLLPGANTAVAFRFTARGGSFGVDDVHVDPWGRR